MGLTIRHDDPALLAAAQSSDIRIAPFTLVLKKSGLSFASHLMNGVIFCAVLSASNSAIYAASRTLCSLSETGQAPLILSRLNAQCVPIYSLLCTFLIGCISFLSIFWGGPFD